MNLKEKPDELTQILYDMVGIKKDDLQPLTATKMANEGWRKWAEAHVDKFQRTNIVSSKELEKILDCKCPGFCATCSELIGNEDIIFNTLIYHCKVYNKSVSVDKDDLTDNTITPDSFKEE